MILLTSYLEGAEVTWRAETRSTLGIADMLRGLRGL
jgi:hypothetical protein